MDGAIISSEGGAEAGAVPPSVESADPDGLQGLQQGSGVELDTLVGLYGPDSDARALAGLAPAFLVLGSALERPGGPLLTVSMPTAVDVASTTALRVYPLARRAGSASGWISVGRARNNDVCLDDVSVSKFHAYFRQEDGVLYLLDARSRNGTFVDGEPVPVRGRGLAVQVVSGSAVRFGNTHTSFVSAKDLHRMVKTLSS